MAMTLVGWLRHGHYDFGTRLLFIDVPSISL
jgi:hypothetical protein